jgi:serine/threonine protein kinase
MMERSSQQGGGETRKGFPLVASDYKLFEEIGQGASAIVYRGLCIPLNEVVAVKTLNLEKCNSNLVMFFLSLNTPEKHWCFVLRKLHACAVLFLPPPMFLICLQPLDTIIQLRKAQELDTSVCNSETDIQSLDLFRVIA